MTIEEFGRVFGRLCVALQVPVDESGATERVYFGVLKDLPIEAIQAGAMAFMVEAGRRFLPSTGEWRDRARRAEDTTIRLRLQAHRTEPWRVECERCDDTGFVTHRCPGLAPDGQRVGERQKAGGFGEGDEPCLRTQPHYEHSYVTDCACRATNRTYQRRHMARSSA